MFFLFLRGLLVFNRLLDGSIPIDLVLVDFDFLLFSDGVRHVSDSLRDLIFSRSNLLFEVRDRLLKVLDLLLFLKVLSFRKSGFVAVLVHQNL